MRAIRRFKPSYLIIGPGFDTHDDDPIGGFALSTDIYPEIGRRLADIDRVPDPGVPGRWLQS